MAHRKRGKRAGSHRKGEILRDIHSRIDGMPAGTHCNHAHNLHGTSATAVVLDAAKYNESALIDESKETHVVPRQSVTRKQLLGIFPQRFETEDQVSRQLDHVTGKMVEVHDTRTVWRSDKTLLRKGNPFKLQTKYKRDGSISVGLNTRKTRETIKGEESLTVSDADQVIPADIEDL